MEKSGAFDLPISLVPLFLLGAGGVALLSPKLASFSIAVRFLSPHLRGRG
jgi:hypothetical protein